MPKHVELPFDMKKITLTVPDDATILQTNYPVPDRAPGEIVAQAMETPIGAPPLERLLRQRRPGDVVIVVSDISRPIPYPAFLPHVLQTVLAAGVAREEILILIATGMHRPSTTAERLEILGREIAENFRVEDHNPEAEDLVELPQKSWAGNVVRLNRRFVEAGFRFITGLVEPHYMAGFSGGRKAVCPGLASLATVQQFHGYDFLANPKADIASLDENPCHLESLSVARAVGIDFSLNVVLNHTRQVIRAFAGELDAAHRRACEFVKQHANPVVEKEYDVVLTSCAGYPLDTTFYQCTKSFVCALPAVKAGGEIVSLGGCAEGIGSESYKNILFDYENKLALFLRDISSTDVVVKDQWQHQMFLRAVNKLGVENLHFFTDAIPQHVLSRLSCNGHAVENVQAAVQEKIDGCAREGKSLCVIPEGPYCAPVKR